MIGEVVAIYVAAKAGGLLEPVEVAKLVSGKGIAGDRYFRRQGTFSEQLEGTADWEVTLIELEEILSYNEAQGTNWGAGDFRRNIVTRGVRLNNLVGKRFSLGASTLEGLRLCEPCAYLGSHLGPEIVRGMVHRAGLRARVVEEGDIRPGDGIDLASPQ